MTDRPNTSPDPWGLRDLLIWEETAWSPWIGRFDVPSSMALFFPGYP